jgi:hypothetical protein
VDSEASLRVVLTSGAITDFTVPTYDEYLAGDYLIAVGNAGSWEIMSYEKVTISGTIVTFTGLIRGRRGTEGNCGKHIIGDYVVFINNSNLVFTAEPFDNLPESVYYKVQGYKQKALDSFYLENVMTYNWHKPFAPTDVKCLVSGSDTNIQWTRRTRAVSTIVDGTAVTPYLEEADNYSIRFYDNDDNIVREVADILTTSFLYTNAMRIEDGFTPNALKLSIAQKSDNPVFSYGFWSKPQFYDVV